MSGFIVSNAVSSISVEPNASNDRIVLGFGELSVHLSHDDFNELHNKMTRAAVALDPEGVTR
jgi:hypothetical protein